MSKKKNIKPAGIYYFIKITAYIGIICCLGVILKLLLSGHPYLNDKEILFVRIIIMLFFPIPFGITIYFIAKFRYIIFLEDTFKIGFIRKKEFKFSDIIFIKKSSLANGIYSNLLVIKIKSEKKDKFYYFIPNMTLVELESFIKTT